MASALRIIGPRHCPTVVAVAIIGLDGKGGKITDMSI